MSESITSVPFNKMSVVGNELKYLQEVLESGKWAGRGPKTLALEKLVRTTCNVKHAFFVTSCTSAIETGCILSGIGPGDEVILPSFGFVSAANAVVLRGAIPVFADIDRHTWNVSVETVEPLITKKTKALISVHYAGSSAGTDELRELCTKKNIFFIEDAAQSLGAKRNGRLIGPTEWVTCFSLHDTKNISSGEGGLIMTDSDEIGQRIEILIEKGTDRQKFFRGQVDKYTWVDMGSSFIASDLLAAVALAQVEKMSEVTSKRKSLVAKIREGLRQFDSVLHWQHIPKDVETNGHIAAFVMEPSKRAGVLADLKKSGVVGLFHYVPLHDSPFAAKNGFQPKKDLANTRWISEGLVRLPVYYSMTDRELDHVVSATAAIIKKHLA